MIKTKTLHSVILTAKILLPAVFCFLCNYLLNGYDNLEVVLIPFTLLIVLPNLNHTKYNITKTIILVALCTILSFAASILISLGIGYPIEFFMNLNDVSENTSELIFKFVSIISYCFISPAIIFYWHRKLFVTSKYTKVIYLVTCVALTIALFMIDIKASLAIALWQLIMMLALQFSIYQKMIARF